MANKSDFTRGPPHHPPPALRAATGHGVCLGTLTVAGAGPVDIWALQLNNDYFVATRDSRSTVHLEKLTDLLHVQLSGSPDLFLEAIAGQVPKWEDFAKILLISASHTTWKP